MLQPKLAESLGYRHAASPCAHGVDRFAAARVNGGMAWYEARTKCIFCRREKECVDWLESPEDAGDPRRFCPNVEFFMRCTQRGVSDYSGMAA